MACNIVVQQQENEAGTISVYANRDVKRLRKVRYTITV